MARVQGIFFQGTHSLHRLPSHLPFRSALRRRLGIRLQGADGGVRKRSVPPPPFLSCGRMRRRRRSRDISKYRWALCFNIASLDDVHVSGTNTPGLFALAGAVWAQFAEVRRGSIHLWVRNGRGLRGRNRWRGPAPLGVRAGEGLGWPCSGMQVVGARCASIARTRAATHSSPCP